MSDLPAIPIFDGASTSVVTGKSEWLTYSVKLLQNCFQLRQYVGPADIFSSARLRRIDDRG
jgi:hypothetical protein